VVGARPLPLVPPSIAGRSVLVQARDGRGDGADDLESGAAMSQGSLSTPSPSVQLRSRRPDDLLTRCRRQAPGDGRSPGCVARPRRGTASKSHGHPRTTYRPALERDPRTRRGDRARVAPRDNRLGPRADGTGRKEPPHRDGRFAVRWLCLYLGAPLPERRRFPQTRAPPLGCGGLRRRAPHSKRCAITLSMIPYCFASSAVMK
jgi:hypothetical protein